jgi:hypothetical protein
MQTCDLPIMLSFLYNLSTERKMYTIIYVCLCFQLVSWFVVCLTTLSLTKSKLMYRTYHLHRPDEPC